MAGYQIYEKVGGQLVPINLTTEERLSQVEQSCLDYHNNGIKKTDIATETKNGIVRLATVNEGKAGTVGDAAMSPKAVKAVVDDLKSGVISQKLSTSELETALKELIVEFGGQVPA